MLKVTKVESFYAHVGNKVKTRNFCEFGLDGKVLNSCKYIWCLNEDGPDECSTVSAVSSSLTSLPGGMLQTY